MRTRARPARPRGLPDAKGGLYGRTTAPRVAGRCHGGAQSLAVDAADEGASTASAASRASRRQGRIVWPHRSSPQRSSTPRVRTIDDEEVHIGAGAGGLPSLPGALSAADQKSRQAGDGMVELFGVFSAADLSGFGFGDSGEKIYMNILYRCLWLAI